MSRHASKLLPGWAGWTWPLCSLGLCSAAAVRPQWKRQTKAPVLTVTVQVIICTCSYFSHSTPIFGRVIKMSPPVFTLTDSQRWSKAGKVHRCKRHLVPIHSLLQRNQKPRRACVDDSVSKVALTTSSKMDTGSTPLQQ